jgi:hypothetical protein
MIKLLEDALAMTARIWAYSSARWMNSGILSQAWLVSFPKIISARSDDAIRTELEWQQWCVISSTSP